MAGIDSQIQTPGVQKWLPNVMKSPPPAEAAPRLKGDRLSLGAANRGMLVETMDGKELVGVSLDNQLAAMSALRREPWTFGVSDAYQKLAASVARTNPDRLPRDVVQVLGRDRYGLNAFVLQVSTVPTERIKYFSAMPDWLLADLAVAFRERGQDQFASLVDLARKRTPAAPQTPATPRPAGMSAQQALALAQRDLSRVPTAERVEALKVLAKEPWSPNVQRAYIDIAASLARSWPDKLPADTVDVLARDQVGLMQFMVALSDDPGERMKYLRGMPDELLLKLQDAFIEAGGPRQILGEIHAALGHG